MKKRQSVEQAQDQQFEQRMRALVEHRVSPSLAVTAVRGGDTVVERGYGWSDLEQGTNASAGTAKPIPVSWVHLAEESAVNLDDFTRQLLARYHRFTFEPGSRYAYSNLGYLVLGQVIERTSGQRYTDYIQKHILEVLDNMRRTGFSYDHLQVQDIATGYVCSWSMMGILGRFLVDRRIFGATRNGSPRFTVSSSMAHPMEGCLGQFPNLATF